MIKDHQPVTDVFWREKIGPLDLEWGEEGTAARNYEDGWGVAKIKKKHNDALMRLPDIISHGEIRKHYRFSDRIVISKGDTFAVFLGDGNGHFLLTGMKSDTRGYAAKMRTGELIETSR